MERTTAGEEEVRVRSLARAITREFIGIEDEFIAGVSCRFWRARFGGEERADMWVPSGSERGRKMSGVGWSGRIREQMTWAPGTGMAQVGCCLPFPFFFDLFPFSFSVFFKSSYPFQI
jgi:hypothetical protein